MKRVLRKEDDRVSVEITTPWLTEEEAAIYCAQSRSTIRRLFPGGPSGGKRRSKRYNCADLDAYLAAMAAPEAAGDGSMIPVPSRRRDLSSLSITDPVDGRVYRVKPENRQATALKTGGRNHE